MLLNLVSRSNLDGISRLKTATQLAEAKVTAMNSNENPQNKGNQKELPQLNKNIPVPSLILKQKPKQKVF